MRKRYPSPLLSPRLRLCAGAYAAVAIEVGLEHGSDRVRLVRAAAAVDSGQAVNPDGIRNQIEGGILQSASWTLYKSVTFDLPLFGSDAPASRVEAKIKSDVGRHRAEFVAPDRSGASGAPDPANSPDTLP